jgi:hypothetical protein
VTRFGAHFAESRQPATLQSDGMANVLLVATGGTRAPTQIDLLERFVKDGHSVRLLASANALRFLASHLVRRASKVPGFLRHYRPALRETLAYFVEKPPR